MRIAYLFDDDINSQCGVVQKILQQANQWVEDGHEIFFVSLKNISIYNHKKEIIYQTKPLSLKLGKIGTALNLLYSSFHTQKLLNKIEFDMIYMRYRLYMPFFNEVLKKYKVIMEINSDDTIEYKLSSKITHYYNISTRAFLLRHIEAFVCVSDELRQKWSLWKKSIVTIANGIDSSQYFCQYNDNIQPIFVFIGTPNQAWHGLEKIVMMAEYFTGYQFYIIGTEGKDTQNIKYFGYLSQNESTKLIQQCDIGIGTLSLYKKGMHEASPLKTRQYLACGLPIVFGYKDTDIVYDAPFALKLENSDNVNYKAIENFVKQVFQNKKIKEQAREFAENILDYSQKERKRLDFFQKVLNES